MPEMSEKRPSVSLARRNTEGKLKLVRSKSKLQNTDTKSKDVESGKSKNLKKSNVLKNEKERPSSRQNSSKKVLEKSDSLNNSSTTTDLKLILRNEGTATNQNGGIPSVSENSSSKLPSVQEGSKEPKRATKKDSEKRVVIPNDVTRLSIDNNSERSVDGAIHENKNTTVAMPTDRPRSVITHNDESWIRSAIPDLPLGLAIVYLILNILVPGSGTILSGFSILCCGEGRVQTKDDQRLVTLCVNVCVGVSQLFTVTFLFVGWFWSIAWGVNMVTLAVEMRRRKKQQREIELQKRAVNAFGENVQRSFFAGMK